MKARRDEGRKNIETAKSELIEKLSEFSGPCLSLDAFDFTMQRHRLYLESDGLIDKYGDILLNPNWKERFFRFDP